MKLQRSSPAGNRTGAPRRGGFAGPSEVDGTGRKRPIDPAELREFDGIVMRSQQSGRVRQVSLRNHKGREVPALLRESVVVNDPAAMGEAALLGLGVAVIILPDVLPLLEQGKLERLLPLWYGDVGSISMYMPTRAGMPAKTRVFVDFVADACRQADFMRRFDGRAVRERTDRKPPLPLGLRS